MNLDDFQDLVDRCGERSEDWPVDVRSEAMVFLAGSAEAKAVVAEAAQMRAVLARPAEPAPPHLSGRIFALAERMDEHRPVVNRNLQHERIRARGNERMSRAAELKLNHSAGLPMVPPNKMAIWLGAVFLSGVAFGIGGNLISNKSYLDFATLFAVLS